MPRRRAVSIRLPPHALQRLADRGEFAHLDDLAERRRPGRGVVGRSAQRRGAAKVKRRAVEDDVARARSCRRRRTAARAGSRSPARGRCRASRGAAARRSPRRVGHGTTARLPAWRRIIVAASAGMSCGRSASGLVVEREDRQAVIEIGAEAAGGDLGLQVAVGAGDDADVDRLRHASRRSARPRAPAARAAAWPGAGSGISAISSSSSVPPSAARKKPSPPDDAPVNAPFWWPNSSASSIVSGSAAQLIAMNGPSRRGELVVDRAGQHFLAGAGRAVDQHGDVGLRDALGEREQRQALGIGGGRHVGPGDQRAGEAVADRARRRRRRRSAPDCRRATGLTWRPSSPITTVRAGAGGASPSATRNRSPRPGWPASNEPIAEALRAQATRPARSGARRWQRTERSNAW